MIKEALDFIFKAADDAANPKAVVRRIGPRSQIVTIKGDQELEMLDAPTLVRKAHTLDAIAALSSRFGTEPTAYISEHGIAVVLDDSDRIEQVVMEFEESVQLIALRSLASGKSQRDMLKILRTSLAGCVDHAAFVAIVRQLEFDVNRGVRGSIENTKESLGRSVEKEVRTKAGEIPDAVRVIVPLFSVPHDVPTEITLSCAVTLDIDGEKIAIEPTGDSLLREQKRVMQDLASRLDVLMPEGSLVVFGECATMPIIGE